jgi:pilus assembly protein Flp/PilA
MHPYVQPLLTFLKSEDGPTAVEYAVVLAFIVMVCIGAISNVGKNTKTGFNTAASVIPNSASS